MIESNIPMIKNPNTILSETDITDLIFETITEIRTPKDININCIKNNVIEIIMNIFISNDVVETTDAIVAAPIIKITLVIIIDVNIASNFAVIICFRVTGFVKRKSAVFFTGLF